MKDRLQTSRTISDGYGDWLLCDRRECGLEVVRPGKVQCWCDHEDGPLRLGRDGESR